MLSGASFDEITTTTAAKILGLTVRRVEQMCAQGVFEICYRPGYGRRAHYFLSKQEMLSRKVKPQSTVK